MMYMVTHLAQCLRKLDADSEISGTITSDHPVEMLGYSCLLPLLRLFLPPALSTLGR